MELKTFSLDIPVGCNLILGQTHFVKTVACLIRIAGNEEFLQEVATKNA
mgnify:CR=1 FL=1